MLSILLNFGGILLKTICDDFFLQILNMFFKVKHSIGHIAGMVCQIDVNQEVSASVGYCISYMTLTFDLTYDLDLDFYSRSNFEIALSQKLLVDWCEMKKKQINWILDKLCDLSLWPHPWFWHWFFKVKILNSLISGMWPVMKGMWIDHSDISILLTHVIFIEQGVYFLWCTVGPMAAQKVNSLRSCVSEWVIIGSGNVLSPVGCQAII